MKKHAVLIGILVLAFVVRVFKLDSIPLSLYWEEAALGYDAYSISLTGKDYHNNPFPLLAFPSFGDYKPSGYFYAIVPFIKLFGLNAWAVRLPSALAGVATVALVYGIATYLFIKRTAFFAALLTALQPWSMHLSRAGFEANLATMLITLGVFLFLYGGKLRKNIALFGAGLAFAYAMYTYHSARIVAPLLALVLTVYTYISQQKKKEFMHRFFLGTAVFLLPVFLAGLPLAFALQSPEVSHRLAETSIFSNLEIIRESNALRERDGNTVLARIMHHRYLLFAREMAVQYVKNFSPSFLFLTGDDNARHGTGEFGVLYHWEFFTVLAGLYVAARKRTAGHWLPLLWICISAVPVAVTVTSPHTLRFASAGPAFALLSAIGLSGMLESAPKRWKKIMTAIVGLVILAESVLFLHMYFIHYPRQSAQDWQYGYQELFSVLRKDKKPGQRVYVTREQGRPSIYLLFYNHVDPRVVQAADAAAEKDQRELLEVGDYRFVDAVPFEKGSLVTSSPSLMPKGITPMEMVKLPDGRIVWVVWENK